MRRWISDLVPCAGKYVDSASCGEQVVLAVDLHENFAIKDVEELLGVCMVVANLG